MDFRSVLGFEKTYSTRNMYISNFYYIEDGIQKVNRVIFRGPYVADGVDWFQEFPNMGFFCKSPNGEFGIDLINSSIRFNELFPDLKRVKMCEIVNILETLHRGDEVENMKTEETAKRLYK